MVSLSCYETTDLNQWIDSEKEETIQRNIVKHLHELNFEIDLIGESVKYAVGYEKLFIEVKYANVILVEYYEHRQKNAIG